MKVAMQEILRLAREKLSIVQETMMLHRLQLAATCTHCDMLSNEIDTMIMCFTLYSKSMKKWSLHLHFALTGIVKETRKRNASVCRRATMEEATPSATLKPMPMSRYSIL